MGKLYWVKKACGVFLLCTTAAIALPAQTTGDAPAGPIFTLLHSFDNTDGSSPDTALVQATNGNFYGTTVVGGANVCSTFGCGTVFKITPNGKLTTLHSFDGADGEYPTSALVQGTNGILYGITQMGGTNGYGTVFKITPSGALTTLHSFDVADGADPYGALVLATNGNFYGTTSVGGANNGGNVFEITPRGTLMIIYTFCSQSGCKDGEYPGGLIQAANGNFYGITSGGGASGYGTVFKITPSGALTTLHSFDGTDGDRPIAALVQATNGKFYGTTFSGGANNFGTVFEITPSGALTTLHSFCSQSGCTDGAIPYALAQGTDGNFYGTTTEGGANGYGTVFKITPSGMLTAHSFNGTDGSSPVGGLVQGTDGKFYGTTNYGGADNDGTVFSLSEGLGPFVKTLPPFGKVGTAVHIVGTNLIGTTSVKFNGTAATFTVRSKSVITTDVPAGTTTGIVQVVTPGGTLSSNVNFRVK